MGGHYLKTRPRRKLSQWLEAEMNQQDVNFITQHVDIFSDKEYKRRSMVNFSMSVFCETILLLKQKGLESEWAPSIRFALAWSKECLPWTSDCTLVSRIDMYEPPSIYVIKKSREKSPQAEERFNIKPIRDMESYTKNIYVRDLGVDDEYIINGYSMDVTYSCQRFVRDDLKEDDEEFLMNIRMCCE